MLLAILAGVLGKDLTALAVNLGSTVTSAVLRHSHDHAAIVQGVASLIRRGDTVCTITSVATPHPITAIILVYAVKGIGVEFALGSLRRSGRRKGSLGSGWDCRVAAFDDGGWWDSEGHRVVIVALRVRSSGSAAC